MNDLIFIGDHFYIESFGMMSSLYDLDGVHWDWGKVEQALANGESVNIRPATRNESILYQMKLEEMLKRLDRENV